MARRALKRRRITRERSQSIDDEEHTISYSVATDEDRRDWAGWVEVESEPAVFNAMLEKMGACGVRVQEIISLDEDMLAAVPRPAFGLIFLYRWLESPAGKPVQNATDDVWFANQTMGNACGTIALLNIINNADGIKLGEHLQQFQDFCQGLSPAQRGQAITHNAFLRRIHNMHARKMDMLATDIFHKQQATEPKKVASRSTKTAKVEEQTSYHFVAYVPKNGVVWCLDGLENQPRLLEDTNADDWLLQVKLELETRMRAGESEGELEFCILCLIQDPLQVLEEQLDMVRQSKVDPEKKVEVEKTGSKGDEQQESSGFCDKSAVGEDNADVPVESELRASIGDIKAERRQEEELVAGRRHDYGPAISAWLKLHVEKKMLSRLLSTNA